MHTFWSHQRQRPQHEGILQDFCSGQYQAIEVAGQVAVQQHIDIQRQALAVRCIAAVVRLDELEASVELDQGQVGEGRHHQIEERTALDAHRLAFEHR